MGLIPARLIEATTAREGEAGRRWLAELPDVVEACCDRWRCRIDGPAWHGEVGLVLPVVVPSGPAVLKISFPHPGNAGEAVALRTYDGRGVVRLLESSVDGFALLLERAGQQTLAAVPLVEDQLEIAGELARRLAVPAPSEALALAATCEGWFEQLDEQLADHPGALSAMAVARARDTIGQLSEDRTPTMLHADLHVGNVLSAEREPWLVIDPKGWSGSAAYDAFTMIGVAAAELAAEQDRERALRDRVRRFATAAVDVDLALACCQARAVSSYLYQLQYDGSWFALDLLRELAELC